MKQLKLKLITKIIVTKTTVFICILVMVQYIVYCDIPWAYHCQAPPPKSPHTYWKFEITSVQPLGGLAQPAPSTKSKHLVSTDS